MSSRIDRTIRRAFLMSVHPGQETEYERRHSPIWPEMEEAVRQCGVRTYSIFLDPPTQQLFAYVECESEEQWQRLAQTEVCRRWWNYMREIMPCNPDDSPVSRPVREVFHLKREEPATTTEELPTAAEAPDVSAV